MAIGVDIQVQNIGSLRRDMNELAKRLIKPELVKILRPGANTMRKAIIARVPVRRGVLKKAVKVKVGRSPNDAPRATLMVTFADEVKLNKADTKGAYTFHGLFVHNGTVERMRKKNRRYTGKIKPNPFIFDAFEAEIQKIADQTLNDINNSL